MQKVLVLDKNQKPLMPTHPARARALIRRGRAVVFRRYPFTIIVKDREGGAVQPVEIRIDPGSKTTGIALVAEGDRGSRVVFAQEIHHRGQAIKRSLEKRRAIRRGRRTRNLRYRKPRFENRTKAKGWLPPSLKSRVHNIETWTRRFTRFAPVSSIADELVRFDLQKMQNPEISGVEYQQGTLFGYEVRQYLLEKWGRKCMYCSAENVPLEVEHIVAKSRGGSDRISNLGISCNPCNQAKDNRPVEEFLSGKPERLVKIKKQVKAPLKDAAAVNATRFAVGRMLKKFGLPVSFWSGGRTKYNRTQQGYPKAHWIDAACVGDRGDSVFIPGGATPLTATAMGHGSRQMCRVDKFGFPRTGPKGPRTVKGFRTGDIVKAIVGKGKRTGTYAGRVAVRSRGSFNIKTPSGLVTDIGWRWCRLLQRADGFNYSQGEFT